MNKRSDFKLTPEQQQIVDKKVEDLSRAVKNIDFNNLPTRENSAETAKPVSDTKHTERA